jgi:membrane protease YdiL (CAAX protease family)
VSDSTHPEPGDRPLTLLAAALWWIALTMTVLLAVSVTESARPGAQTDIVNLAACELLATSIVVFAMVRWHASDVSLRVTLGMRPLAALRAPLAIAAGAGLAPLMATVQGAILRRWPIGDPAAVESLDKLYSSSSRVGFVVAALVIMPIAQEVFFRGILYGGLRSSVGVRAAMVATTLFYACASLEPREMPTAVAVGLAMAWLRERSGTVLAPILAQLAFGAVDGVPILRGRDLSADVTYPTKWIAGGAAIALLALAAVGAGRREE